MNPLCVYFHFTQGNFQMIFERIDTVEDPVME